MESISDQKKPVKTQSCCTRAKMIKEKMIWIRFSTQISDTLPDEKWTTSQPYEKNSGHMPHLKKRLSCNDISKRAKGNMEMATNSWV
jgi:hypothetical protein